MSLGHQGSKLNLLILTWLKSPPEQPIIDCAISCWDKLGIWIPVLPSISSSSSKDDPKNSASQNLGWAQVASKLSKTISRHNKNEPARGAPPDCSEGRGLGAETEGRLSTSGPIGEPFRGIWNCSWEHGLASLLGTGLWLWAHVPGRHLPPSMRPGEARNAGQQLEERRQAHEGERVCVWAPDQVKVTSESSTALPTWCLRCPWSLRIYFHFLLKFSVYSNSEMMISALWTIWRSLAASFLSDYSFAQFAGYPYPA